MTPLIDVIFLLLLFFMLTSTFTRFSEIQLSAAGAGAGVASEAPPLFVWLGVEGVSLNGTTLELPALRAAVTDQIEGPTTLLVSADDGVTSQRLVDLLVALGLRSDLAITVLE